MQQNYFSIIVLNHNNLYINQCIESIKKYKAENDEIIIIDDHSTNDNYENLLKHADKSCKILQNTTHPHNLSYSRNLGARNAKYNYLLFLDGDAYFYNECINQLRHELSKEDVVCVAPYADCMSIAPLQLKLVYKEDFYKHLNDGTLEILCKKHFVKDHRRNLPIATLQGKYNWCYFYGICQGVKKDAFLAAGQFDDSLSGWGIEDIDFTFRLKNYGQLKFVPQAQLFHIPHTRNRYKNYEQNAYNYMECLRKYNGLMEWELNYKLCNLAEVMSVMERITYLHRDLKQQVPIETENNCVYINAVSEEFPNGNVLVCKNGQQYFLNYIGLGIPVRNKQFKKCYLSIFLFNYPAPILSILLQESCRIAEEVLIYKKKLVPSINWGNDIEKKCTAHSQRFEIYPVKLSDFIFEDLGDFYKVRTGLPDTPYDNTKGVYYEFI